VRALLIVNPRATSTTLLRRDVIARALESAVELDVEQTRYRGHAAKLAASARAEGFGLVLALGGDGTANETINGILGRPGQVLAKADGQDTGDAAAPAAGPPADQLPAFAMLPGGSANVFTGSLGLPRDPVDAVGEVLRALAQGRTRTISLGLAGDRYFALNAGMGLDAEVVRAVQGLRAHGRPVTPALYVRLTLRQFYRQTDRRHPRLTIEADGQRPDGPVFIGIVSNTDPWTYLGNRALHTSPRAGFDTGLDVFALRRLSSVGTFLAVSQMLRARGLPHGRNVMTLHDQPLVTLRSQHPVALQIDGEYVGEQEVVSFRSVSAALRVVA
jgi:diacylglycerol kinase family enzyme